MKASQIRAIKAEGPVTIELEPPEKPKSGVGVRWIPGPSEFRDSKTGVFEHVNPPLTPDEVLIQAVLISKPTPRRTNWRAWWALFAVLALVAAWQLR